VDSDADADVDSSDIVSSLHPFLFLIMAGIAFDDDITTPLKEFLRLLLLLFVIAAGGAGDDVDTGRDGDVDDFLLFSLLVLMMG
jgi:hypothetical protein